MPELNDETHAQLKLIDFEKLNANSTTVVPVNLNIKRGGEEERKLGKEILKFYTNKEAALSWEDIHGYVDFFSDIEYVFPLENSRQSFLKHSNSPVYTYKFAYTSPRALSSMLLPTTCPDYSAQLLESGACHGDELVHLFKTNFANGPFIPPTADEQVFMKKFVKAWTSFAKTGDPNCKDIDFTWTPDNITNPHYLELGKVCKVVDGIVYQRRVEFWTKLYEKYSFSY